MKLRCAARSVLVFTDVGMAVAGVPGLDEEGLRRNGHGLVSAVRVSVLVCRDLPAMRAGAALRPGTVDIALIGRSSDYLWMPEMVASTAAEHLNVSVRQVERLARAGDLTVTRTVGGALLIDATSVHRLAQRSRKRGRPASAATAWAAIALLSVETVTWLDRPALSRLRHRLRAADADSLSWLTRRRAAVRRMQGWGGDYGLLSTGVSALRDPAMSALFGLSPVDRGVDGYVRACQFDELVANFGLFDDVEGDVTVRVVPDDAGYAVDRVLTAAVAIDLADSLDARESASGKRVVQGMLDNFRQTRVR